MTLRVYRHTNEPINQLVKKQHIGSVLKTDRALVPLVCLGSVITFRLVELIFF